MLSVSQPVCTCRQEQNRANHGLNYCSKAHSYTQICRAGQDPKYTVYIVYTVFLAGKPPNIRSYTVYIYGSGQPVDYARDHLSSGQRPLILELFESTRHQTHVTRFGQNQVYEVNILHIQQEIHLICGHIR